MKRYKKKKQYNKFSKQEIYLHLLYKCVPCFTIFFLFFFLTDNRTGLRKGKVQLSYLIILL